MKKAKDYIIFPLDVPATSEVEKYVDLLTGRVGLFKVGLELFVRFGPDIVRRIETAGAAGVFLDLKLHDIPATVSRAMAGIADLGVRFATVHCGENHKMMEAAVEGSKDKVGILGVTVLTSVSAENIKAAGYRSDFYPDLSKLVIQRAQMAKSAGCVGVVCSGLEAPVIKQHFGEKFVTVTPGIRPLWATGSQDDQRRITTPSQAVKNGSDFLVIGRPIRESANPRAAVQRITDEIAEVI
jgi:orotidine-5'-phosphate decarboxylase